MIDLLHAFRANVDQFINNSSGYHHFDNKSAEVLEFYGFIGYLLRNGILGRCIDQVMLAAGMGLPVIA